jgi:hypothetical protein
MSGSADTQTAGPGAEGPAPDRKRFPKPCAEVRFLPGARTSTLRRRYGVFGHCCIERYRRYWASTGGARPRLIMPDILCFRRFSRGFTVRGSVRSLPSSMLLCLNATVPSTELKLPDPRIGRVESAPGAGRPTGAGGEPVGRPVGQLPYSHDPLLAVMEQVDPQRVQGERQFRRIRRQTAVIPGESAVMRRVGCPRSL